MVVMTCTALLADAATIFLASMHDAVTSPQRLWQHVSCYMHVCKYAKINHGDNVTCMHARVMNT